MKVYYSSKFAKEYKRLPHKVKMSAERKEKIFRLDPFNQQLKTDCGLGTLTIILINIAIDAIDNFFIYL